MQSTPFEVKRLEYLLRVDASTRCPGTFDPLPESPERDAAREPEVKAMPLIRRIAAGIGATVTRRAGAQAH